ncbi:MAG TPA: MBL fold metallo-hydrolase [Chloroflexi bacterium]|jgi:phosphoribosyl 1,2-cyclic phosphate phosphodiesterase|nr:MBL fold metallo-hydrolase [Chloroflexota bacterium]
MRVTVLGSGTSHGVPMLDCVLNNYERCPHMVCLKARTDPRYRRMRASILVEVDGCSILVDTSQDFRQQMLAHSVRRIDAVIYTHGHADHIYGLADMRSYSSHQGEPIPIYGSVETLACIRGAFDYVFNPPALLGGGVPLVEAHVLDGPMVVAGALVTPVPVEHGPLNGCLGVRIGDTAYIPDVKRIPDASLGLLEGLDLLIINCLRLRSHATHLTLDESLRYVRELQPRRALLTHLSHDIDADVEGWLLPSGVAFARDGLVVECV